MGIGSALNISATGLRVAQDGLDVVAGNIANAETEGFTRRRQIQGEVAAGNSVIGVRTITIERVTNEVTQQQLRDFAAVNVNNQIQLDFLSRVDVAFGAPGSPTAIDTGFNNALASLDILAASPEDFSAQIQAVTDLEVFIGQLNNLSQEIQSLRAEADTTIAETVTQANNAIQGISDLNSRIVSERGPETEPVALLDERDRLLDELAQILEIDVEIQPNQTVQVRTTSGVSLVESQPFNIEFNRAGTVTPETNVENGTLSSILVTSGPSFQVDLVQSDQLAQGALGAYIELRDEILPQIQRQLDEFAAQIALAVSNFDVAGTVIPNGQSVDVNGIREGNIISLGVTDTTGTSQSVSIINVTDPTQLPLDNDATADPNDVVFGVDFNSPTAAADIQAFLATIDPAANFAVTQTGTAFDFTATPTLPATASIDSLSANLTSSSVTGSLPFPLFTDSGTGGIFSNAITSGRGVDGFASRIQLNSAVRDDPSLLSQLDNTGTNVADPARVNRILNEIRGEVRTFTADTGLGTAANPVEATIEDFLQIIISRQGQQAEAIELQANASQISFDNVQERLQAESSVDIDTEIARLIQLEQTFQANARVLTTIEELFDALLAI